MSTLNLLSIIGFKLKKVLYDSCIFKYISYHSKKGLKVIKVLFDNNILMGSYWKNLSMLFDYFSSQKCNIIKRHPVYVTCVLHCSKQKCTTFSEYFQLIRATTRIE